MRLVTLVNHGARPREFDLTSYAEVCLEQPSHGPGRSRLSQSCSWRRSSCLAGALSARRRPRGADEKPVWAIHVTATDNAGERTWWSTRPTGPASWVAVGRRPTRRPWKRGAACPGLLAQCSIQSLACGGASASAPGGTARVAFVTGAAETREAATALAEHFRELNAADRAFDLARESARKELRELGLTSDDIAIFNRLARCRGLHWPRAAPAGRRRRQPAGAAGPVATRHLRRPPHRAGDCRHGRRRTSGPPTRAMARLRAPPWPGLGLGHPG